MENVMNGRRRGGCLEGAHSDSSGTGLGFARVDVRRGARQPLPEVILGKGKTPSDIVAIARVLLEHSGHAIATRLDREAASALREAFPEGRLCERAMAFAAGRLNRQRPRGEPAVAVVSAGTADLRSAEEAAFILEEMRVSVRRFYDVGVAGIHRLGEALPDIEKCGACIAVAGMDAALPSVLGGLIGIPLVAVPTSTGYGSAFEGLSALLSMLNSCVPGVVVVNIDNGLGAAAAALRILRGRGR